MKIALTGATGFLGRYILAHLAGQQHTCRCWHRATSDRSGLEHVNRHVEWVEGELGQWDACRELLDRCDALVHAALEYPRDSRMLSDAFTPEVAMRNVAGSLQLFEAARAAGVRRVVFISSCAVYDRILDNRPLDETHPLLPGSHYGAHKAALEAFVHSHSRDESFSICALRPTGIYGIDHPVENSKWYELVSSVVRDEVVTCRRGGKEVHARDVAQAVSVLLASREVSGESFNCYDRYISEYDVATLAKGIAASHGEIDGGPMQPKHQIDTKKLRRLGVQFGGTPLLVETIREMVSLVRLARGAVV